MTPPGFVRVDMEGSPYTQRTLDFVHELHRRPGHANSVGTVIQSYLRRSESDVEKLLAEGIRIRLCKGAYKEPADIAFQSKAEVDANYVKLMKICSRAAFITGSRATTKTSSVKRRLLRRVRTSPVTHSSSRCSTVFAATYSRLWCEMVGECVFTFRSEPSGIRTSCAV